MPTVVRLQLVALILAVAVLGTAAATDAGDAHSSEGPTECSFVNEIITAHRQNYERVGNFEAHVDVAIDTSPADDIARQRRQVAGGYEQLRCTLFPGASQSPTEDVFRSGDVWHRLSVEANIYEISLLRIMGSRPPLDPRDAGSADIAQSLCTLLAEWTPTLLDGQEDSDVTKIRFSPSASKGDYEYCDIKFRRSMSHLPEQATYFFDRREALQIDVAYAPVRAGVWFPSRIKYKFLGESSGEVFQKVTETYTVTALGIDADARRLAPPPVPPNASVMKTVQRGNVGKALPLTTILMLSLATLGMIGIFLLATMQFKSR